MHMPGAYIFLVYTIFMVPDWHFYISPYEKINIAHNATNVFGVFYDRHWTIWGTYLFTIWRFFIDLNRYVINLNSFYLHIKILIKPDSENNTKTRLH